MAVGTRLGSDDESSDWSVVHHSSNSEIDVVDLTNSSSEKKKDTSLVVLSNKSNEDRDKTINKPVSSYNFMEDINRSKYT